MLVDLRSSVPVSSDCNEVNAAYTRCAAGEFLSQRQRNVPDYFPYRDEPFPQLS